MSFQTDKHMIFQRVPIQFQEAPTHQQLKNMILQFQEMLDIYDNFLIAEFQSKRQEGTYESYLINHPERNELITCIAHLKKHLRHIKANKND